MRKIEEREGRREIKEGREKENKNTVSKEGIKFKRQKINHQFKGKHKKKLPHNIFWAPVGLCWWVIDG